MPSSLLEPLPLRGCHGDSVHVCCHGGVAGQCPCCGGVYIGCCGGVADQCPLL